MRFKTIGMRVWLSFSLIIVLIISLISVSYFYGYNYLNLNNQKKDLLTIHNILINRDYNEKIRFEDLNNLKYSSHFIYNGLHHLPINNEDNLDVKEKEVEIEVIKLAKGNLSNSFFEKEINGSKYIVYITYTGVKDGYFISYMPIVPNTDILFYIITIGVLFILCGLVLAKTISKHISQPLKELEHFSEKVSRKEFEAELYIKSEDEIGSLANSMLAMRDNLKRVSEEEKLFLQSISHDLKTPVSVIIAHADAIIDGVYIDSIENTAEIIKNEASVLNRKIRQLLYLNTLEFSLQNQEELEEINVKELLINLTSRFKFFNNSLVWKVEAEDTVIIADYDKISVSLENIIDNAIRYAKTKIELNAKLENNIVHIEIINDGENISKEALEKIFDNLYKDKKGKFGLGLAISKKIIEHYNGEINAENILNGVKFNINLPCEVKGE